tara:strand:- start:2001 stop:2666 length:666 start_codon:yes stop_codon:yes gene_type:complete
MDIIISFYGIIINVVVIKAVALSIMCLIITTAHSYTYRYLLNKAFIFTALMLAPLVLAVTTVIATNLYLSLGMIGALSIVRYRTPVKSQYELALFFSFICLGIISGVDFKLSISVFILLTIVPFIYEFLIKKIFNFKFFNLSKTSFEKSNSIILDIVIHNTDSFEFIKKHNFKNNLMKIETNNETKESFLTLVYEDMDDALNTKKDIEKSDAVKNSNLTNA